MPWQSAPPLAIITVAMGAVSGLMSLTNYLTVGRTDRLIGLDDFDYMCVYYIAWNDSMRQIHGLPWSKVLSVGVRLFCSRV